MLNKDYKDILSCFAEEGVDFLLVGAYALAAHGYPRATMDIDLWVRPSLANAEAVLRALRKFGAPLHDLTLEDLQKDDTIFQIGVAPRRIDIVTGVSGLHFEESFSQSSSLEIEEMTVRVPTIADLIRNKRATGKTRDLADAEALELLRDQQGIGTVTGTATFFVPSDGGFLN